MDEFIKKDEAFVEQWLVRQGLEKLADVFSCYNIRVSLSHPSAGPGGEGYST